MHYIFLYYFTSTDNINLINMVLSMYKHIILYYKY